MTSAHRRSRRERHRVARAPTAAPFASRNAEAWSAPRRCAHLTRLHRRGKSGANSRVHPHRRGRTERVRHAHTDGFTGTSSGVGCVPRFDNSGTASVLVLGDGDSPLVLGPDLQKHVGDVVGPKLRRSAGRRRLLGCPSGGLPSAARSRERPPGRSLPGSRWARHARPRTRANRCPATAGPRP